MRVLLKEGAAEATAASIIVLPTGPEAAPETLSCEDAGRHGVVAEADTPTVADAIHRAVRDSGHVIPDAAERWDEVRRTARSLLPYELGSRIGGRVVGHGWELDDSRALAVDRVPDLLKGDAVIIGPPAREELVNARARVVSIDGGRVGVEIDPGDRDRIERSTVGRIPMTTFIPRGWLEPAEPRRGGVRSRVARLRTRCTDLVRRPLSA